MERTLILDLDGTLVDSVPDLTAALNRLMTSRNLATFTEPEIAAMVGDGARVLVERGFAARASQPDATALADFLTDYTANAAVASRAYPGVPATLALLRNQGWRLAVCTNKPETPARLLLAALNLDHFFAAVGGGDSFPSRKPDPAHVLATLYAAGGTPSRAIMAGDHHNDVIAATNAGLPSIFASWGYGTPAMATNATRIARHFSDLPTLAHSLLP